MRFHTVPVGSFLLFRFFGAVCSAYTEARYDELHANEHSPGALARIAADVVVEGLPLPELPGARTVGDLRSLREWPQGLRLVVEPRDVVVRVERIRAY